MAKRDGCLRDRFQTSSGTPEDYARGCVSSDCTVLAGHGVSNSSRRCSASGRQEPNGSRPMRGCGAPQSTQ